MKQFINVIFAIIYCYIYVFFISYHINSFFHSKFSSWGIGLIIFGVWGNVARMTLLKPLIWTDSYKKENYFTIALGGILFVLGLVDMYTYYC